MKTFPVFGRHSFVPRSTHAGATEVTSNAIIRCAATTETLVKIILFATGAEAFLQWGNNVMIYPAQVRSYLQEFRTRLLKFLDNNIIEEQFLGNHFRANLRYDKDVLASMRKLTRNAILLVPTVTDGQNDEGKSKLGRT